MFRGHGDTPREDISRSLNSKGHSDHVVVKSVFCDTFEIFRPDKRLRVYPHPSKIRQDVPSMFEMYKTTIVSVLEPSKLIDLLPSTAQAALSAKRHIRFLQQHVTTRLLLSAK